MEKSKMKKSYYAPILVAFGTVNTMTKATQDSQASDQFIGINLGLNNVGSLDICVTKNGTTCK